MEGASRGRCGFEPLIRKALPSDPRIKIHILPLKTPRLRPLCPLARSLTIQPVCCDRAFLVRAEKEGAGVRISNGRVPLTDDGSHESPVWAPLWCGRSTSILPFYELHPGWSVFAAEMVRW